MVNKKHVKKKLGHQNLTIITSKYDPAYKKHGYELVDKPKRATKQKIFE